MLKTYPVMNWVWISGFAEIHIYFNDPQFWDPYASAEAYWYKSLSSFEFVALWAISALQMLMRETWLNKPLLITTDDTKIEQIHN
jgi:hypothetical protein